MCKFILEEGGALVSTTRCKLRSQPHKTHKLKPSGRDTRHIDKPESDAPSSTYYMALLYYTALSPEFQILHHLVVTDKRHLL